MADAEQRVRQENWPEALPGCDDALRYARDPVDYARSAIRRLGMAGELVNLARNGDFTADSVSDVDGRKHNYHEGGPPAGWHALARFRFRWHVHLGPQRPAGQSGGTPPGVSDGCFLQSISAEPGQHYAVAAKFF